MDGDHMNLKSVNNRLLAVPLLFLVSTLVAANSFTEIGNLDVGRINNSLGALQPGKIVKPEIAAQRLYMAWRRRNRGAASAVASKEAIHTLFANRWRAMAFKGCELGNSGEGFICRFFTKDGGVLEMGVEGGASAGYGVQTVSLFSAAD